MFYICMSKFQNITEYGNEYMYNKKAIQNRFAQTHFWLYDFDKKRAKCTFFAWTVCFVIKYGKKSINFKLIASLHFCIRRIEGTHIRLLISEICYWLNSLNHQTHIFTTRNKKYFNYMIWTGLILQMILTRLFLAHGILIFLSVFYMDGKNTRYAWNYTQLNEHNPCFSVCVLVV